MRRGGRCLEQDPRRLPLWWIQVCAGGGRADASPDPAGFRSSVRRWHPRPLYAGVCRWWVCGCLTRPRWLPLINELSEKVEFPAGGNARATSAPFLAGPAVCGLRGLPQRLL